MITAILQHQDTLAELYGLNIPVWKLAQTFALDHGEVCQILEKQGIKPSAKLSTADYPEIAELYEVHKIGCSRIAELFGTNHKQICDILRRCGVEMRANGTKINPEHYPELILRYEQGEPTYEIGRSFGVTAPTVRNVLKANGVPIVSKGHRNHFCKIPRSRYAALASLYSEGKSVRQIAYQYKISEFTVYKILKCENLHIRRGQPYKIQPSDYPKVVELYEQKLSTRAIASRLGCSDTVIRRILHKQGVELRATGRPKAQ